MFTRSIDAPPGNEGDSDLDDAKQWAAIGFVRALDSHDPTRTSLLTFGKYWMRAKVERHLLVDWGAISVGAHVLVDASVVRRARRELSRNGTKPTIEALAEETRLSRYRVEGALASMKLECRPLVVAIRRDGDGDLPLAEALPADEDCRPDVTMESKLAHEGARIALGEAALRILKPRYWHAVTDRRAGRTLEEISKDFGVTRERIRQIEVRAMERLREARKGDARVAAVIGRGGAPASPASLAITKVAESTSVNRP